MQICLGTRLWASSECCLAKATAVKLETSENEPSSLARLTGCLFSFLSASPHRGKYAAVYSKGDILIIDLMFLWNTSKQLKIKHKMVNLHTMLWSVYMQTVCTFTDLKFFLLCKQKCLKYCLHIYDPQACLSAFNNLSLNVHKIISIIHTLIKNTVREYWGRCSE